MIKAVRTITASAIVISFVILASCAGNSNKNKNGNLIESEIQKDQVEKQVTEFVYPLPTSFEVTNMLNRIGASYILSLSNPVENVEKYFTEKSMALNLGVYGTDLSYASTYNQKQVAIDYMNASNKLIEELNFSDIIDKTLPEKFQNAENDKEQLIELISNTFYETYEYLNETNRAGISMLILTGSWVEALYITTHISEDTYNNVEMVKIVMEQKAPLNKLMELIAMHNNQVDVKETGEQLKKLHAIFNELDNTSITKEQLKSITDEVNVVRTAIIK